jgi:hypothetical protein
VLVQFPHYITPKEKLSVKIRSYAKKKYAKQYYVDSKHKKIVKNPLQKGTQSIGT